MRWTVALGCLLVAATSGCSAAVDESGEELEQVEQRSQFAAAPVESSADVPKTASASHTAASRRGALAIERVVSVTGEPIYARVSARFVRVSGSVDHRAAERLVGTSARPRSADRGCAWQVASSAPRLVDATSVRRAGSIELLDVGEIVLHVGSHVIPLAQRAFPDVGDIISGVLYTSRNASVTLPSGLTYFIETTGGATSMPANGGVTTAIDGFTARSEAPESPSQVRVAGRPLAADMPMRVAGTELTWDAGSIHDLVFVELTARAPSERTASLSAARLRCVFVDDGTATIPAGFELPAGPAEFRFHRLRRAVIDTQAIQTAVEFDFAITAPVVVTDRASDS